jgi:hypothetical protein
MNNKQDEKPEIQMNDQDLENRRELVRRLGKFAAYAAPFTVLASTGKAIGGHGSGGGPSRKGR